MSGEDNKSKEKIKEATREQKEKRKGKNMLIKDLMYNVNLRRFL